jgi:HEAT repeat protein
MNRRLLGVLLPVLLAGCGIERGEGPADPDYRRDRVVKLGRTGGMDAVAELQSILVDPKEDALVKAQAATELGRIGDPVSVPALLEALEDPAALVRRDAAEALGKIGDAKAASALVERLARDLDDGVRRRSAQALGLLKDPIAIDALIAALEDPAPGVRIAAHDALRAVTGQTLGPEPSAWKTWRGPRPH